MANININNSSVNLMEEGIVQWINRSRIECFYAGIRADCALDLGIAPNNPRFHAAWDSPAWSVSPADYGRDLMVAFRDEYV